MQRYLEWAHDIFEQFGLTCPICAIAKQRKLVTKEEKDVRYAEIVQPRVIDGDTYDWPRGYR